VHPSPSPWPSVVGIPGPPNPKGLTVVVVVVVPLTLLFLLFCCRGAIVSFACVWSALHERQVQRATQRLHVLHFPHFLARSKKWGGLPRDTVPAVPSPLGPACTVSAKHMRASQQM
jgi:hypothetical protein